MDLTNEKTIIFALNGLSKICKPEETEELLALKEFQSYSRQSFLHTCDKMASISKKKKQARIAYVW